MILSTNNSYKFNWNQPNQGKNGVNSTEIRKGHMQRKQKSFSEKLITHHIGM